jgi:hypothetical protein
MGKINLKRMILGGLLAGVVINLVEFIAHGMILKHAWAISMAALGLTPGISTTSRVVFIAWGFLVGLVAVWLYAGLRPRYGAGPKTALRAGLAFWVLAYLTPAFGQAALKLFPSSLMLAASAVGLVAAVLATLAGAWLYREEAPSDLALRL